MKTRLLIFLFLTVVAASTSAADVIKLKSGKTLTGRISAENDTSYTLRLGANMFLSVAKDEVASVKRDKPQAAATPVPTGYRMLPPKPVAASSATAKGASSPVKTPAAASAVPTVAPSAAPAAVKDVNETTSEKSVKVGLTTIVTATRSRTYPVDGKTFADARAKVMDLEKGKGFLDGRKRRPSQTGWDAAWSGSPGAGNKKWASLVVNATVTVTLPAWNAPPSAPAAESEQWAAFVKEAADYEAGHSDIIQDTLRSFAESVNNLAMPGEAELRAETQSLFKSAQDQATKRRQGYDRRVTRPPLSKKKK